MEFARSVVAPPRIVKGEGVGASGDAHTLSGKVRGYS